MSLKNKKNKKEIKKEKQIKIPVKVVIPKQSDEDFDRNFLISLKNMEEKTDQSRHESQDTGFINKKQDTDYSKLSVRPLLDEIVYKDRDIPECGFIEVENAKKEKANKKERLSLKIKSLSEQKRAGIMWSCVALITVILFIIWIATLRSSSVFDFNSSESDSGLKNFNDSINDSYNNFYESVKDNLDESDFTKDMFPMNFDQPSEKDTLKASEQTGTDNKSVTPEEIKKAFDILQ